MASKVSKIFAIVALLSAALTSHALVIDKVTDNVYALVGELGQRTASNFGNNATFGVIITSQGVVLINSGATWKGAREIDKAIRTITDKPIKLVINTGGQDHNWLGNSYFKDKGAKIIASKLTVDDQHKRSADEINALSALDENMIEGTLPIYADESFDEQHEVTLGETSLVIHSVGPAHTVGDSIVWLPKEKIAFSGDVVSVERMPGMLPNSNSKHWLEAFDVIAALSPEHIVPGHGFPTSLERAKAETYDYLIMLRSKVGALISSGAGMEQAEEIDQSTFSYLLLYDGLKGGNAQQIYSEMEWE